MNDIIQWAVVAIVLIAVALYIARKLRRKSGGCSCCEMNGKCHASNCANPTDQINRHDKTQQP